MQFSINETEHKYGVIGPLQYMLSNAVRTYCKYSIYYLLLLMLCLWMNSILFDVNMYCKIVLQRVKYSRYLDTLHSDKEDKIDKLMNDFGAELIAL